MVVYNAAGRPTYQAVNDPDTKANWTNITKKAGVTSLAAKNQPPYYKATTLTSDNLVGAEEEDDGDTDEDISGDDMDNDGFDPNGSAQDGSAVTPGQEAVSSNDKEKESVQDIINSNATGDETPEEAVTKEKTDEWGNMFDATTDKKLLVYSQYVDEKNLASGITLRNTKTLSGMKSSWLGQKGIFYQAEVEVTFTKNKKDDSGKYPEEHIKAISNIAGINYSWGADVPVTEEGTPPTGQIDSYGNTEAYAELKEGSVYNETFEAMAGVPSTRSLYFSTGGSEFIVNLQAEYEYSKKAVRTYRSLFQDIDCEYKEGDTFKGLSKGQTKTETFKADKNDATVDTSVVAESNNMVNPVSANSGFNTTTNEHGSSTEIYAQFHSIRLFLCTS